MRFRASKSGLNPYHSSSTLVPLCRATLFASVVAFVAKVFTVHYNSAFLPGETLLIGTMCCFPIDRSNPGFSVAVSLVFASVVALVAFVLPFSLFLNSALGVSGTLCFMHFLRIFTSLFLNENDCW